MAQFSFCTLQLLVIVSVLLCLRRGSWSWSFKHVLILMSLSSAKKFIVIQHRPSSSSTTTTLHIPTFCSFKLSHSLSLSPQISISLTQRTSPYSLCLFCVTFSGSFPFYGTNVFSFRLMSNLNIFKLTTLGMSFHSNQVREVFKGAN